MKKFLAVLLVFVCLCGFVVNVSAEEESVNLVSAINSGFEEANTVEETAWFRLNDAFGDSKTRYLDNIEIKTGDAHSGLKYLSTKGTASWRSPSINLHPFFVDAGPGEYMITFFFRCKEKNIKSFTVRALESDYKAERDSETFPSIKSRGNGNYFSTITGEVIEMGDWDIFTSDPFEVAESSLVEHRNWWFCFAEMPNNYTVDIDDFCIIPADEYEDPNKVQSTDVTYISEETKNSVVPVTEPDPAIDEKISQIVSNNGSGDEGSEAKKTDITLYVCIAIGVVAVAIIVPTVIIKTKKKK